MEVMVGSPFRIGMAAYVRDRGGVSAQDKAVPAALFLADGSRRDGSQIGIGLRVSGKSPEESSEDSSSSIGESSENEEEEEDDGVSFHGGALDSFSSTLEDSLPIKRGLSNHYVGKSKSFGNLMEASNSNVKDLEKGENPFNKRRRLLIANKLRRRGRSLSASNFYTWQSPNSTPLLALQEDHSGDDYEEGDGDDQTMNLLERRKVMVMMKNKRDLMAQTQSCFCLSSLQEEDDDDDDDDDDDGGGDEK